MWLVFCSLIWIRMCLVMVFGVVCNGSGIVYVDVVMGECDEVWW